ncbi:L-ascorbate peroxidase T, chloroplastic-like isoform X2 [Arachis stenosperma]|uniref:L-ascorbate peroxidase T, chloroplastic-like isoform X2 n=1 Tax=Arachis stenosperma TaxID=217475 RepID=UPI0025ABC24E|nr:L-ascorbate peroxidase T, chloroplastic-like isoform X2 [Arachis stenosperma]
MEEWMSHHLNNVLKKADFQVYAKKYAEDQVAFFNDYAEAHAKLSNLGAKFDPPEGIVLDPSPKPQAEKFEAAKYSTEKD